MVKRIVVLILFMLFCVAAPVLAQDCYNYTRTRAISYYEKGEYRIAREHFRAAKDCPDKPADNDLDAWIGKCASALAEMERNAETERLRRAVLSSPYHNGHRYVDLGLSVLWADSNIGATSPEEYGNYYAYGEVTTKERYSGDNYLYGKYESTGKLIEPSSEILPASICNTKYDAAHTIWGGNWRMPTKGEIEELFESCKIEKEGNLLKLTGPNGNHIYLPLGSHIVGNDVVLRGSYFEYWTGSNDVWSPIGWSSYNASGNETGLIQGRIAPYHGALIRPVIGF